jgi:hypothetical protein
MPAPDTIKELSNLYPPSPSEIEDNARRRSERYIHLETVAGRTLNMLTTVASTATAGVGSGRITNTMRQKVWLLMESEIKKVNNDMATIQQDVEFWQTCAMAWQKFMWGYFHTLVRSNQEMDKMETDWAEERNYLVSLCRGYIPEVASERSDLNQLLQDDDSAEELEADVSLERVVDMYLARVRELKARNDVLEQELLRYRAFAGPKPEQPDPTDPTAPMQASRVQEEEHTGGQSTALDAALPSTVHIPIASPDTEAFNHVTVMYQQTRDLLLELLTAHRMNWEGKKVECKKVWVNINRHFHVLCRLSAEVPPTLANRKQELDLEIREPEPLPCIETEADWQPYRDDIKKGLEGKDKGQLVEVVNECKEENQKVIRDIVQTKRS